MKKYILAICLFLFLWNQSFASFIDDSISKELEKELPKRETITLDFKMKTYDSCEKVDEVLNKYFENQRKKYSRMEGRNFLDSFSMKKEALVEDVAVNSISLEEKSWAWLSSDDFSKTNTQISGVDEAEIIKTDWKYIYYFSEKWYHWKSERFIQVLSLDKKKIIKKIKIPEKMTSVEFYLSNWKLIILWSLNLWNSFFYKKHYSSNSQSYLIVYDVSNPSNSKLEKLFVLDWYYSNSRLIWDKIYMISKNHFYDFYHNEKFSFSKSIPEKIEADFIWKKHNYHKKSVSECKNIEFILPEEKYFERNSFNLSYDIISVLDLKNLNKEIKSKVIVWNWNSEIFMNEKNLYLTSNIYTYEPLLCRWLNCLFPSYESRNLTLVNKFSLWKENINYQKSALIEWNPLTQYSMDEDKNWNFRILTQLNSWTWNDGTYVNFYILDKDLKLVSKLEKLWVWEEFKSSRYIWDKLFLVTFERTDPLFVIDLKDSKNPKILWELKIPGYSTYLHPYDENHLIWLGYDTKENKWWGIQNNWVKIDLYQINYDKKCGDKNLTKEEKEKCDSWDYKWIIAKQLFTKTFWWNWSSSEALHNPKMFMWNASKNKLFLPVELRNYDDKKSEIFFWLLALDINKNNWIKENFRVSNLDLEKVKKDFEKNCKNSEENKNFKKVIANYYCWENWNLWEYLQNNSYFYRDYFVNRALWIWENFYSFSPNKIKANNINSWKEVLNLDI